MARGRRLFGRVAVIERVVPGARTGCNFSQECKVVGPVGGVRDMGGGRGEQDREGGEAL